MKTYILPGMGADSTMYSGPWRELADTVYIDWPIYNGERTLSDVAERIISEHNIKSFDFIAGSSMGGMVALEIAEKLNIQLVILVGSAISKDEINPLLTLLAPLVNITPLRFSQSISGSSSSVFSSKLMKTDANFIKSMCIAVSKWSGTNFPDDKITRLHGTHDLIIKCPKNCTKVKGAGHLLALTHPAECVVVIKESINKSLHSTANPSAPPPERSK